MSVIKCQKCSFENQLIVAKVSRRDSCEKCAADFHACIYCRFYSRSSYNECLENKAERVLEKDRANYCDFFELKEIFSDKNQQDSNNKKTESSLPLTAREQAEALFKKA